MGEGGLLPSCWGPAMWHSIHSIAMKYEPNEQTRQAYYTFFASLGFVLPCEECKAHYNENFRAYEQKLVRALTKPALDDHGLFKWTYNLHNLVNKQTGVPENEWPTYESVLKKYENFRSSSCDGTGVCGSTTGGSKHASKRIKIVEEFNNTVNITDPQCIIPLMIVLFLVGLGIGFLIGRKSKK